MTITDLTPIGEIAAALPSSVRVFQHLSIDFCCGGKRALGAVCRERGFLISAIVADIEASARQPLDNRDWTNEPLDVLVEHIVTTYHHPLRDELPRLEALAAKVASVHGSRAAYLIEIQEIIDALSVDLTGHMHKEETVLFPAIRAIAHGSGGEAWLAAPISVMEQEHDRAGALLADLRELTGSYTPPEWGCATLRALYQGLEELEGAMHVHVHLENNVLFPRAQGSRPLPSVQS